MTELNPEQERVVEHVSGPIRVGAVAGSGKTHALIERVAYLINKKKVSPRRILMISFSRAARDEMKRRIEKRLPASGAGSCVRTFHSLGLLIFQREGDPERRFMIDNSGIMWLKATERAYRSMHRDPERSAIVRFSSLVKNEMVVGNEALHRLGKIHPRMAKIASECARNSSLVEEHDLIQAFFKAEHIRLHEGVDYRGTPGARFVTFDDMIYESAKLLIQDREVRERWAAGWDYVLQDECQDENRAQAAIAEALASRTKNYMIVGDPAQSIFGWRGARPERMLHFEERWPDAETVVMFRNYRSGIEIVEVANRIMGYMPADTVITDEVGYASDMRSERQTHAYVGAHHFQTSKEEAACVADNIEYHQRDGVPYREQAVLVRMNRMTKHIEVELAKKAIPYKLVSGQSFFSMLESKVLFGYLRVIANRADQDAFEATVKNPTRRLGNKFVAAVAESHDMVKKNWIESVESALPYLNGWQKRKAEEWLRFVRAMRNRYESEAPKILLQRIRTSMDLDSHFKRNVGDEEDSRSSDNMNDILAFASNFDTCNELLDVVERVERHRNLNTRKRDAVTISTVHKAKGMEWQVVYLMQCANGWFPASAADLAEERRCFYVAVTRAKDELWISRPSMSEGGPGTHPDPMSKSRFVHEAKIKEEARSAYRLGKAVDPMRVGTQVGMVF